MDCTGALFAVAVIANNLRGSAVNYSWTGEYFDTD